MPHPLNKPVRQKVVAATGTVTERRFNESHSQMEYLVVSGDGTESKWFLEDEIEVVPETLGA